MRRRHVLGGMLALALGFAAVVLAGVLGTVFFAVTVAYLLAPVRRWLVGRGLTRWTASLAATLLAFAAALVAVSPLVVVAYLRVEAVVGAIADLPAVIPVELLGYTYTVTLAQVFELFVRMLRSWAQVLVRALPVLALKLSLFVLLVFALVSNQAAVRQSILAVIPGDYRDVAEALNERTRDTLFAIYVLQAVTAFATFVVAIPFFVYMGYPLPVTLAIVAAVLQFIPVVGPSVLLVAIAGYHVATGDPLTALFVAVVGGFLIGLLPDLVVRPRLARETTGMPGSLYFVGFVGGILSLGVVGIIAGPLVVARAVETGRLVADELADDEREDRVSERSDGRPEEQVDEGADERPRSA